MPPPPPEPKPPGIGARRRASQTDIRAILDEPPEPGAIREPRAIVPQPKQTWPGIPGLPIDYRVTVPASAITAPTLPASPEPTSLGVPSDEKPSLAPPSATPEAAALVASRADADRLRAKVAELERDARAVAETKTVSYPPAKVDRSPTPPLVSVPPDGSVESLRKALTKLILGIAAVVALLGTPLAIWVSNIAAEAKTRAERASTQVAQASTEADAAKAKASTNAKDAAATEREFRQYRANMRELMRLQGVEIPKSEGDPEPADLKPYAPLCPAGKVCTGAQLIITRPL